MSTASCTRGSSSSTEAHARIRAVDAEAALAVPGVVAVLTAADLPTATGGDRTAEPLARDEVVFAGQPVAIVVAESEAAAEDGVEAVVVEYEPLDAVVDVEQAMAAGAPLARVAEDEEDGGDLESIHAGVDARQRGRGRGALRQRPRPREPPLGRRGRGARGERRRRLGHVPDALGLSGVHRAAGRDRVAGAVGHARRLDEHAGLVRHAERARARFGLPLERIRVVAEPLGGAFGGKFALVEPLVAGAALALGRPVRLVLTRAEDFQATNPASAQVTHLRLGARKDGTLTGIEARMIVDRGSNAGWGVEGITSLLVAGPYRWEAHDLRGYGVQTNRFTFGAYRAPGAPTAAFAVESLLDELAEKLELDPIELRLKNAVVEGDVGVSGNPFPVIGAVEVLERIREHPLWARARLAAGGRGRSASPPATGPAATSPRRRSAASTPTGR